jgi:hypothetical protein
MRDLRALIVLALLACASASAAADDADCNRSDADTTDDVVRSCEFRALVPSTPELAAIVAWQDTLLNDDFEGFLRLLDNATNRSRDSLKREFEQIKPRTPRQLVVRFERAIPNGTKEYTLIGCRFASEMNKDLRFLVRVYVRQDRDSYRVSGGGRWSTPSYTWDKGPVS